MYHVSTYFDVHEERVADFIGAALADGRDSLAHEPGTVRFELIQDEQILTRFWLNEAYTDRNAFEREHVNGPYFARFFELVKEYAKKPKVDVIRGNTMTEGTDSEVAMYFPAGVIEYGELDPQRMCGDGRLEKLEHAPVSPQLRAEHVKFINGAHTKWHYHTGEQLLMPTDGVGFVELKGLPLLEIRLGDRVFIPSGVWHRHGARKGHAMIHIAVTSGETVWDTSDDCADNIPS
jgi:autoinducer 2-degrading protein